jgi:hypothetical protein
MTHAVITADIVNSTELHPDEEKTLMASLQTVLSAHKFEFYRGDSFQVFIKDPKEALRVVLQCRTAAISVSEKPLFDVRSSIGIGTVETPIRKLATAKGEAFILSGRAFDKLDGKRELFVISVGKSEKTMTFAMRVIARYIDSIFHEITSKQAEVLFELLKGKTQQTIAEELKKSKSTISEMVSSAKWPEIERVMEDYHNLINEIK